MAYKYINDNGLKAYTKKVKGALKDLHTPIAISTENTTESKAQNVKNIADFVAKAKAAGIADVNGMAVTCLLDDNAYSGVGYIYNSSGDNSIQGVLIQDDLADSVCFSVYQGQYAEIPLVTSNSGNIVTSTMLVKGARNPIILTPETTEVDEATYQKLLSDDVDVVFIANEQKFCVPTYRAGTDTILSLSFSAFSCEGETMGDTYLYGYQVDIAKTGTHSCEITPFNDDEADISSLLHTEGFINKYDLSPVLQEIDLTGTDAERKAGLTTFEATWKALTGARNEDAVRFVGRTEEYTGLFTYDSLRGSCYFAYAASGESGTGSLRLIQLDGSTGSLTITPLFSHLEPVEIFSDNSAESKKKNLDNLNAYKANLEELGVDTSKSFQVPIQMMSAQNIGFLYYTSDLNSYRGIYFTSDTEDSYYFNIGSDGEFYGDYRIAYLNKIGPYIHNLIKLKDSSEQIDININKTVLSSLIQRLKFSGVDTSRGYQVSVVVTSDGEEYTGTLNIGTGTLLMGIVSDLHETHHYPFHVEVATGIVTFDKTNYFLEKTSNEVTEMLDAIKYSYTPVPLTATTLSNKAQLEVFLSKVPTAQVMHVTYKDVYAGTLHKINGDWFGLLVKNTNNYEDALQVKLQADGTLIEGTTSLAQVNAKLDTIIG